VPRPGALTTALATLALALGACGDDEGGDGSGNGGTKATTAQAPPPAPGCQGAAKPEPKGEQSLSRPDDELSARRTHVVTLATNCGEIEITLDVRRAPKTTASFASLVKRGFYDGLTFHRIARDPGGGDFVIQGGDPLGTGQGGPGYSVEERPPRNLRYTRGVVAMAKTEIEDAGTSGSQFYIVTAEDAGLPPEYALVGKVTGGEDAVARIAAARTDSSEVPLQPVVIGKATLAVT
jgi:peptidyl-prolyl cis-trans isomerase B (cyclophilin B)